jgi:hypothetical protein
MKQVAIVTNKFKLKTKAIVYTICEAYALGLSTRRPLGLFYSDTCSAIANLLVCKQVVLFFY